MIVSSFLSQYGIRLSTREFTTVSFLEFKSLLAGISPDTALGRVVAIRSETDEDIIKHFSASQRQIHTEWEKKRIQKLKQEDFKDAMQKLEQAFIQAFG